MSKKRIFNNVFNSSIPLDAKEIYIYDIYHGYGAVSRMCCRFFQKGDLKIKAFLVAQKGDAAYFEDIPIIEYKAIEVLDAPILIGSFNRGYIKDSKSLIQSDYPNADIIELRLGTGEYDLENDKWQQFFEQFDLYHKLMDDESRMIYRYKSAYDTFGGDWRYIRELLRKTKEKSSIESENYRNLLEFVKASSEEEQIRFVLAGEYTEIIPERISELGYPVEAYWGDQKPGNCNISNIEAEDLFCEYLNHYILVKDYNNRLNFINRLSGYEFIENRIVLACDGECGIEYNYPMYFDEIFKPSADGIFVDGGCFDGGTIGAFIEWNGNYKKIYSFEPEPEQYKRCKAMYADNEKVKILNNAVWDKKETLRFVSAGGGSHVSADSSICVEGISVDEVVGDEKVTFLKYDIEGSELKGLIGAKNTITRNKPDLAICVYHRREDLYTIPYYILSLCPDYKIYLRHYQLSKYETVLLATCR